MKRNEAIRRAVRYIVASRRIDGNTYRHVFTADNRREAIDIAMCYARASKAGDVFCVYEVTGANTTARGQEPAGKLLFEIEAALARTMQGE